MPEVVVANLLLLFFMHSFTFFTIYLHALVQSHSGLSEARSSHFYSFMVLEKKKKKTEFLCVVYRVARAVAVENVRMRSMFGIQPCAVCM